MPEIQDPELDRRLRQTFGIHGDAIQSLSPELVPVVIAADLTQPEESAPGEVRPSIGGNAQAAGVGNIVKIQLFNPPDSGVEVLVEAILIALASASITRVFNHDTQVGSVQASTLKTFRDRRIPGEPSAEVSALVDTSTPGEAFLVTAIPASEPIMIPIDLVLAPGQGIVPYPDTTNISTRVTYYWTERPVVGIS